MKKRIPYQKVSFVKGIIFENLEVYNFTFINCLVNSRQFIYRWLAGIKTCTRVHQSMCCHDINSIKPLFLIDSIFCNSRRDRRKITEFLYGLSKILTAGTTTYQLAKSSYLFVDFILNSYHTR